MRKRKPVRKKERANPRHTQYKRVLRTMSRRSKPFLLSLEDYLEITAQPCSTCSGQIGDTGTGFVLKKPRLPVSKDNCQPLCNECKLCIGVGDFTVNAHARNQLRRNWKKTPMAQLAMARARKGLGRYQCAACAELFGPKDIQLDHILPVVDVVDGYVDLNVFAARLFCSADNLAVLCKPCHQTKTNLENATRRTVKKNKS